MSSEFLKDSKIISTPFLFYLARIFSLSNHPSFSAPFHPHVIEQKAAVKSPESVQYKTMLPLGSSSTHCSHSSVPSTRFHFTDSTRTLSLMHFHLLSFVPDSVPPAAEDPQGKTLPSRL